MRVFQVRQATTGSILWTGAAAGDASALEAMAHEAGYLDAAHIPQAILDRGLKVEVLNL
ncbi:hypothetical protein [Methylobacterium iners]|uniref:Uncharacterized protein n=1 Tax=Methylobacterium iners TaxID=418707 RepID=A0ABQ4S566_9HYPH|nr:hypothetical protein [Methylobacterium iners]GJD96897.1 hypothetical protein OCOJLMKI_4124 [Methylobacterium iners]